MNNHLEQKRSQLLNQRAELLARFMAAAEQKRPIDPLARRIHQTNDFLTSLDIIEEQTRPLPSPVEHRYRMSSLFIVECFKKLNVDKNEQFFFVTGCEVGGSFILDQIIEFPHEKRTATGVTGDVRATHRVLIRLEQFGHKLLACLHIHPGRGAGSTHPSGIDEQFQERLERAGHVAIAGIFSRDGYVRFFRLDKEPEIEVFGHGVERQEKNVYRLTQLD